MKAPGCLHTNRLLSVGVAVLVALVALSGCRLFQVDPVAILASPAITGPTPLTIRFDVSHSMHPKGRPLAYTLEFGDGSPPETGTDFGIIIHHTYEDGGVYEAVLTVTDDLTRSATDALTITASADGPEEGTEVGMSAPDFTAHTIDGGTFTLSEARSHVLLIDFWGAWCTPCKSSLPHLDDLVTSYAEDGLIAVLVSTDAVEQDSIDYLAQHGYTGFVSVWEPGAKYTPIAEQYGVLSGGPVGIPHTFVLDRQGVIRWRGHPLDLSMETIEALL